MGSNTPPTDEATPDVASASEGASEETTEQLVVMRLADEDYGVSITHVREIIRMQNITSVPQAPPDVEGIINLRGSVIPVVDLRRRFGLDTSGDSSETRIVVVDAQEQTVGLVVDAVNEVITVGASTIEPVGNLAAAAMSSDLRGIVNLPEKLIILISLENLLGSISGIESDELAA